MANTNLNLLSYEQCEKLKRLNFNYYTEFFYRIGSNDLYKDEYKGFNENEDTIACPSPIIVRQWLRNEFEIDTFIARLANVTIPNLGYGFIIYCKDNNEPIIHNIPYESYEEAEIGLINLILEKNCDLENAE